MKRCSLALALLLLAIPYARATVITGKVVDLTGLPAGMNRTVTFDLMNCGQNAARVVGSSVIVPTTKTIVPNAASMLTGSIVGNDIIECGSIVGQTYYRVTLKHGAQVVFQKNFFISGPIWNIATANALNSDPTAFLNNGYLLGDLLFGAGTNVLGVLRGNTTIKKKYLTQIGTGTISGPPAWEEIAPEDIPPAQLPESGTFKALTIHDASGISLLSVQAGSGQGSEPLTLWKNAAGATLASVAANGAIVAPGFTGALTGNATTATTATTASALAADPSDCSNQFARGINATGAAACATVSAADMSAGDYSSKINSGTYGINITGNAGTVTNGLYSNGSYSDPSWLTSVAGTKVSGELLTLKQAATTNVQLNANGSTYFKGGNFLIGTDTDNATNTFQVTGTGTFTGDFLGINRTSLLQGGAGRAAISIKGSTSISVLEMLTGEADSHLAGIGLLQWSDRNTTAADKRVAYIYGQLSGQTANNRGGDIMFGTKPDGASGIGERMRITQDARINITGDFVGVNRYTAPGSAYVAGRSYLSMQGSNGMSIVDLNNSQAESDGLAVGSIQWSDPANALRLASFSGSMQGTTAGNRGGMLSWGTKVNGGGLYERMRIQQDGTVGINHSSPTYSLSVGAPGGATLGTTQGNSLNMFEISANSGSEDKLLTYLYRNTAGSTTATSDWRIQRFVSGSPTSLIRFANDTTAGAVLGLNEGLWTVASNGRVGIKTSNPSYDLHVLNDSAAKPTANWTTTSDARVKTNIRSFLDGLDLVKLLEPKVFEYNGQGGTIAGLTSISPIAQAVQDIAPYMVTTYRGRLNLNDAETDIYNLNSSAMTWVLTNAVKQLVEYTTNPVDPAQIEPACNEDNRGKQRFISDEILGDHIKTCGRTVAGEFQWKVTVQF